MNAAQDGGAVPARRGHSGGVFAAAALAAMACRAGARRLAEAGMPLAATGASTERNPYMETGGKFMATVNRRLLTIPRARMPSKNLELI